MIPAHKIVITVAQAEDVLRLLPAAIAASKAKGEKFLCITVKVPDVPAEEVRAFLAGTPRDHVTGKMG